MDYKSKKTITVYHGTTIEDAKKISSDIKIAKGYGEFGQGFYTVFSQQQAFHIAAYYWDSEKKYEQRKTGLAVVSIDIPMSYWEAWIKDGQVLCYKTEVELPGIPLPDLRQKWSKDEYAQDADKGKDRGYAVIIGPIKDRSTPYLQAVFGSRARTGLQNAQVKVVATQKTNVAVGRAVYPSSEAVEEKGSLNQSLSADNVLSAFKAHAATCKSEKERFDLVNQVFGGFSSDNLPDGQDGEALIKFLKESGLKTEETTPDGVIYDYIKNGIA